MMDDGPEIEPQARPSTPEPVSLTEFQKYAKLQPELQCYILSFANYNTLANYACCSSDCNKQVQKFNNRVPSHIGITEKFTEDGSEMEILLKYKKNDDSDIDIVRNFPENGNSALEYLTDKLQYAKHGKWASVCVDVHNWPIDIMNIPGIKRCRLRKIFMRESMYGGFYDWIQDGNHEEQEFILEKPAPSVFVLPAQFFKTEFFQNLSYFKCECVLNELPEDDFLTMKATRITISWLPFSDEIINRKLVQWFENPIPVPVDYKLGRFHLPENNINKDAILRNLTVVDRLFYDTVMIVKHSSGVKTKLQIEDHQILFHPDSMGMMLYNFSVTSKSAVTRLRAKRKLRDYEVKLMAS